MSKGRFTAARGAAARSNASGTLTTTSCLNRLLSRWVRRLSMNCSAAGRHGHAERLEAAGEYWFNSATERPARSGLTRQRARIRTTTRHDSIRSIHGVAVVSTSTPWPSIRRVARSIEVPDCRRFEPAPVGHHYQRTAFPSRAY